MVLVHQSAQNIIYILTMAMTHKHARANDTDRSCYSLHFDYHKWDSVLNSQIL